MSLKKRLDFTDVETGFKTIPIGEYEAFVFNIVPKVSQAGNEMYQVAFKIADGEHKGRQVFTNLTFVDTAMFKIREFLEACKVQVPSKAIDVDFALCIGKKVRIKISHKPSKKDPNEPFANVDKVLPLEFGLGIDVPPDTEDTDDDVPFK
jgi:hypothetical protein